MFSIKFKLFLIFLELKIDQITLVRSWIRIQISNLAKILGPDPNSMYPHLFFADPDPAVLVSADPNPVCNKFPDQKYCSTVKSMELVQIIGRENLLKILK